VSERTHLKERPPLSAARAEVVYLAYRGSASVLRRLPETLAEAAASVAGLLLTGFRRDARAMYARHLTRVLGRPLSNAEIRDWTRRAFSNYAHYWLDGARLASLPPEVVLERFTVESGYEHLVDNMALGKGVVMALPHVGSWEWGGAWLALKGYPMTSVAEPVEPQALYDFFAAQREAMGLHIFPLTSGVGAALLRTLRDGGLVGLLCDRDIQGNGVEVEFFGERTTLPAGAATLALRSGAALVPVAVYIGPGQNHTAVIMPPVKCERTGSLRADVARVTQALASDLEELIRRAPDQWYVFQPNWPSDRSDEPPRGSVP
jgi:phosphatidylinositol dimannoside acyltransferase